MKEAKAGFYKIYNRKNISNNNTIKMVVYLSHQIQRSWKSNISFIRTYMPNENISETNMQLFFSSEINKIGK